MTLLFQKEVHRFFPSAVAFVFGLFLISNAEAMRGKSIFDGAPSEEQCRLCHGDNTNQPHPRLQVSNDVRHHSRIGQPIIGLGNGSHDTVAPGDIYTGEYTCLTCHGTYNNEAQRFELFFTRNCLDCHSESSVTGSPMRGTNVHHYTETFYSRGCSSCHNFLSSEGSGDSGGSWGPRMRRR